MEDESKCLDVAVVGGGLVGALIACLFAKRDHKVRIYEYRPDIRVADLRGQSIDLSLSHRGRAALREVGLEDLIINHHAMPMRGRMIHMKSGKLSEMIYDRVHKNCIYSVNRMYLNKFLLDAAEKYPNVQLNFNEKLVEADLENGKMKFLNIRTQEILSTQADLIIGADGAFSTVRKIMSKRPRYDCGQTYIDHGYVELFVPPASGDKFVMSNNHLHVWPRGEFMMIALPNSDKSFTGNLFAPFKTLDSLNTPERLLQFYREQFPDVLPLIGEKKLVDDFFETEPKTLISIKCKPYHVGNTALIIGDAAHAMVPFYAQGMNAGFEDVLLLDELMQRYDSDLSKVLPMFTEVRCDDAHAICDLAMYNYLEMRDLVARKSFMLRKSLDTLLYKYFPNKWMPLYDTVHFSRMGFRMCMKNKAWQDKIIQRTIWSVSTMLLAIFIGLIIF